MIVQSSKSNAVDQNLSRSDENLEFSISRSFFSVLFEINKKSINVIEKNVNNESASFAPSLEQEERKKGTTFKQC